jgi:hypothetical protein
MAAVLLSDALWDLVEPFLLSPPGRPKGGGRACRIARECGISSTSRCSIGWRVRSKLIGRGRWSIAVPSAQCMRETRAVRIPLIGPSAEASVI